MNTLFARNDNIRRTQEPVLGGSMSGVHFGPVDEDIKLVFLHANGFNGLSYRSILEPLGVHCLSLDLRGHGLTNLPTKVNSFATFHTYADDVADYLKNHINGKIILAGHSLGASTAVLAALKAPEKVSKTLIFDPVVLPAFIRIFMATTPSRKHMQNRFPLARSAGKRRDVFGSYQSAYERYHGRRPFQDFPDTALWDYVCGGFVPFEDKVHLACRPKWEQFTYTAQCQNMTRPISKLPAGSHIILTDFTNRHAKRGGPPSTINWLEKARRKRGDMKIEHRPDLEHFFPMTNPEVSVPALKDILGL